MSMRGFFIASAALALMTCADFARADEPAPPPTTPEPAPAPAPAKEEVKHDYPKAPPPPYSLPWQLRGVVPVSAVRSDTTLAFMKNPSAPDGNGNSGSTIASTLFASYKVTPEIAPFVRLAFVKNHPTDGDDASVLGNPAVGATYGLKMGEMRLGLMLAATVPVGSGGGEAPTDPDALKTYVSQRLALGGGIRARSAMDNALFATNFLTIFPGVGLAWISGGLTLQAEATVLFLQRVRGNAAVDDKAKTNLTAGLHVGYFLIKELSVGAEIRHQRWLNTPSDVDKDEDTARTPADKKLGLRDQTTWAIGVRGHLKLGDTMWLRPGVAFAMPIDDPMKKTSYKIVQIDVPFIF